MKEEETKFNRKTHIDHSILYGPKREFHLFDLAQILYGSWIGRAESGTAI